MSERFIGYAQVFSQSLPGDWRPFSPLDNFWNAQIVATDGQSFAPLVWTVSEDSDAIITEAKSRSKLNNKGIQFSKTNNIPIWNIIANQFTARKAHTQTNIYTLWDANQDDCLDGTFPYDPVLWWEGGGSSGDAHICLVDLTVGTNGKSWELSKFYFPCDRPSGHCGSGDARCGTYNEWDLSDLGYEQTQPWPGPPFPHGATSRGGRGGGTPEIAGILRHEEVMTGDIRHALCFTYSGLRCAPGGKKLYKWPPCCRADTDNSNLVPPDHDSVPYMVYGTRIRIKSSIGASDFTSKGIVHVRVLQLIETLKKYGAYCVDYGGDGIKLQRQRLHPNNDDQDALMWDTATADPANPTKKFLDQVKLIPTDWFEVLETSSQDEIIWEP